MKYKALLFFLSFAIVTLVILSAVGIYTKNYFTKIDEVYFASRDMLINDKELDIKIETDDEKYIYEYFNKLNNDLNEINNTSFENYKKSYLNSSFYKDIVTSTNNINSYLESEEKIINSLKKESSKEEFLNYLKENNVNKAVISHLDSVINDELIDTKDIDQKFISEKANFDNLISYVNYLNSEKDNWSFESNSIVTEKDSIVNNISRKNLELGINVKMIKSGVIIDNSKRIPILMYHGVSDETWGIQNLFIKVSDFEKQIKYISENYETIFIEDIEKDYTNKKVVSLTFDDAYVDFYTNVFPILKKYNLKANLYVIVNARDGKYLSDNQIKEISNSGLVSIGSHTVNHYTLKNLSNEQLDKELKESKEQLEKLIDKEVKTVCYPSGSYDSRVISFASKYYDYGLAIHNDTERMNDDFNKYAIKRYRMYRNTSFNSFKEKVDMAN